MFVPNQIGTMVKRFPLWNTSPTSSSIEFVKQLRKNLDSGDNSVYTTEKTEENGKAEIEILRDALAKGVPAASLKKRIAAREKELEEVKAQRRITGRNSLSCLES
ncbi:MAG: hypothetical protein JWN45_759 [Acidobacteriaceae bacterium]|nr:hypothetical protein [Acidobacteriaceae bacterium]